MKSIIIIGAGIAGLSTGIYAQRNGYDTTIYESHFLPGGLCTSWRRGGFTFEGCMHYIKLVGATAGHVFHRLWEETGVVPEVEIIHHDIFHTFQDASGRTLNLYTGADRLEEEMLSLSPADAGEIKALCRAIRRYTWFLRTAGRNPFRQLAKGIGILATIPLLKKYGSMDLSEYASHFSDPLIRHALSYLFVRPEFACTSLFFILAGMHMGSYGYPRGGTLSLAKAVERKYVQSGGRIEYQRTVRRVVVQNGRATGIELMDGTVRTADIVISAADGHATLFDLLEDRFTTPELRERFATQPVYSSFIQVSLGVNRDLSGSPHAVKVLTATPFEIAGEMRKDLWYHHFAFDSTLAPRGKSAVTVLFPSNLAWWEELGYGTEAYQKEKEKVLRRAIAQLEQVLPAVSAQIEVSDVATPLTMLRYTNNWKASPGFMMTKALAAEMTIKPKYVLPRLDAFYMTGQWVKGFGVPMAATSGKEVVRQICRADGRRFRSR